MVGWISLAASPSQAAPEDLTTRIEQERQELKRLTDELALKRAERARAERRTRSLLSELEDMDYRVAITRREMTLVELNVRKKDQEIDEVTEELNLLGERLRRSRAQVDVRLRTMYKEGKAGYLRVLFDSRYPADLFRRYGYIRRIVQQDREILRSYQADLETLRPERARLEELRMQLGTYMGTVRTNLDQMGEERKSKARLLARLETEQEAYQQAIRELEESSRRLRNLIHGLETRKRPRIPEVDRKSVLPVFSHYRGRLSWPVEGVVTTGFGLQRHPRFGAYVERKGIEIRSRAGEPIRAVFDGSVAYADWFKGYGIVVIIDHGESFYTVYAHADKVLVTVGDQVKRNQIIGEVGDTGMTREANLYFEVRQGGEPMDPMAWLSRRKGE